MAGWQVRKSGKNIVEHQQEEKRTLVSADLPIRCHIALLIYTIKMSAKLNSLINEKDRKQLQEYVQETSTEEVRKLREDKGAPYHLHVSYMKLCRSFIEICFSLRK